MISQILVLMSLAQAAPVDSCAQISSDKQFYFCTLTKHPRFEVSKLKVIEGDALVEKASQWQNPEVSIRSLSGTNAGENVGSTEVGVSVSLSQLWLRGPAKDMAEAEKSWATLRRKNHSCRFKKI